MGTKSRESRLNFVKLRSWCDSGKCSYIKYNWQLRIKTKELRHKLLLHAENVKSQKF